MITPEDIYSFYFADWMYVNYEYLINHKRFAKHMLDGFISNLKNKYVNVFLDVIQNQVEKYIRQGRIDDDVDLSNIDSNNIHSKSKGLQYIMSKTYRSNMKDRNDNWNALAYFVNQLVESRRFENNMRLMDRINNQVHNTGETMITKLPNKNELLQAFDFCHLPHQNGLPLLSKSNFDMKNVWLAIKDDTKEIPYRSRQTR